MRVQPFTAVVAAVTVVAGLEALSLGTLARRGPLVVIVPLAVLVARQLYLEFQGRQPGGKGPSGNRVLAACGWAAALPALLASLGFLVGSAVFVILFQRFGGGDRWRASLVVSGVLVAFVWALFQVLLPQSLPVGLFEFLAAG